MTPSDIENSAQVSLVSRDFSSRIKEAIKLLTGFSGVARIVSHYDSDGICSAGILCNSLLRRGIRFHASLCRSVDSSLVEELKREGNELIIFCDMGSGQIGEIEKMGTKVIIMDHHVPLDHGKKVVHINPHLFGINGSIEASASATCFVFALALDEKNWDLCSLALAGCIGDKQDLGGLRGLNKKIVLEAISKGILEKERGLNLEGKNTRDSILYSIDPFFAGLTGRKERVQSLLKSINIDGEKKINDLHNEEKRALSSILALKLLEQGTSSEDIEQLVIEKYWSPKEGLFARELSNMVDACGRMDKGGLGLALCMGDKRFLKKARDTREEHREKVRNQLIHLEKEKPSNKKAIQFFYTNNPRLAGTSAGIGIRYLFDRDKPVFALTTGDKETRVSCRATHYLVDRGVDLASACRNVAQSLGGNGGGHPIASGATIPKGKEKEFLEKIDKVIGKQMSGD